MGEREQRSREFGVKLAKAVRQRATEAASEQDDLDARFILLGAGEYLCEEAWFRLNPPLDPARTNPEERES